MNKDFYDIFKIWPYNFSMFLSTGFTRNSKLNVEQNAKKAVMIDPFVLTDFLEHTFLLSERDKLIIKLYFVEGKAYKEIGNKLGIGPERVGQILKRIRRKINNRRSERRKFKTLTYEESDKVLDDIQNSEPNETWLISGSDLSVRAYNCLFRKGIRDFHQLIGKKKDDILKIRCCGEHTYDEIIKYMLSHYPVYIDQTSGEIKKKAEEDGENLA